MSAILIMYYILYYSIVNDFCQALKWIEPGPGYPFLYYNWNANDHLKDLFETGEIYAQHPIPLQACTGFC
jgi:hypothetical protein